MTRTDEHHEQTFVVSSVIICPGFLSLPNQRQTPGNAPLPNTAYGTDPGINVID